MDLIQKAINKGFIFKNKDYYLWEIQKWLREVYKLHITIFSSSQESWMFRITEPHQKLEEGLYGEDYYTYEEALEMALLVALEEVKDYTTVKP